ncbi:restriction endonuclease subunit S [Veillonella sp.]|uniref:restriction endonuclease subunit S n=1 Tax=Veillonella sp. TaxID=1926307 RepID=UPI00257C62F8|nr:restriction endonuclease subunit S [Veillonella sp.]
MYCVKFKDVFPFIKNGANIKQDANAGGIPITRIETLAGGEFNTSRLGYANIFDASPYREYVLNSGDVLMSHINSPAYLGRAVVFEDKYDVVIHGMNLLRLKANKELINPRYAVYLFNGNTFKEDIRKITKKSVNQASFSINDLKEIKLQLPSIESQIVVAEKLDKLKLLIKKKNKLILFLDELIKSRFVEMFGDLNHNPLYPVVNLKSLIMGSPSNGFFASKELYDKNGKVNLVGVKEVVGNLYINIYDTPKLNVDESILEKYLIDYGDMLFCRSSLVKSGIAKASIVPKSNNKSCIFECHTIKIKFNQQLCIPEFMQVQTEQTYFRNQVIQNSKTATMTTISQQGIVDTKVLLPPLSIQQKFTKFLSQINKLKSDVQKSIDETQLLMDSLMQEYFG